MKRKFITLLASLVLILTASSALADNVRTSGLFTYILKGNGTATITKFDWEKNGAQDVFVPSMLDGYTVTGIGDRAFARENPSGAVNVTLPETIISIGEKAFYGASIKSINIPNSVELIMPGAMRTENYDVLFNVSSGHPKYATIDGVLYSKDNKELIAYAQFGYVGVFSIPNGIKSIGAYAFCKPFATYEVINNRTGVYVNLPATLTSIGDYAFANTMPFFNGRGTPSIGLSTVEELGEGAFYQCEVREKWQFSNELTTIPDYAFYRCRFSKGWKMPVGVMYIGKSAFELADMDDSHLVLPSGLEYIGDTAFCSVQSYTSELIIPDAVTYIGIDAFNDFRSPRTLKLPNSDCEIKSGAFLIYALTSVEIPENIKNIDVDTFERGKITMIVSSGSYGELFAKENGFTYSINGQEDDLSWLN